MRLAAANRLLAKLGHPQLKVEKIEGVYYLLGTDASVDDCDVERCLHVCTLAQLDVDVIRWKLNALIERSRVQS